MQTPWGESVDSAQERVRQFLADYESQWLILAPAYLELDSTGHATDAFFAQWKGLMMQTAQRHLTETTNLDLAGSFSSEPEYSAQHASLVSADRIAPYVALCAIDAPLGVLPDDEASLDENRNFTNREVTATDGTVSQAEVTQIGTLVTTTGVLSIWDFGWDNDEAQPLARTVAPGSYPIDRVTAFGRNAAVRVRFSEEQPVQWRDGTAIGRKTNTVGVDAGSIFIGDYPGYAAMTPRAKSTAQSALLSAPDPGFTEFSLATGDVGFACMTGWGDGSYPVYWGVDAAERVLQVVIDFSVLISSDGTNFTHL